ncbi:hypothetical protein P152DRAFT_30942 [Eremomyces bilateralis CBS 781.70]|uniref:Uncharacterized protein n=1 Tax=Eremomyces bilateralis CBS 781.70 TaxID=1392243 RepID=A0A6G1G2F0_9PEZI|nr:uncharacterized protein P152DRAFT_30942 [Eremomyces bilateralis CBS 781.70]KAF1812285.1 hypothetical protein P152DRAFT_30942 [Eremomyces bilateralis CBS 781.70]
MGTYGFLLQSEAMRPLADIYSCSIVGKTRSLNIQPFRYGMGETLELILHKPPFKSISLNWETCGRIRHSFYSSLLLSHKHMLIFKYIHLESRYHPDLYSSVYVHRPNPITPSSPPPPSPPPPSSQPPSHLFSPQPSPPSSPPPPPHHPSPTYISPPPLSLSPSPTTPTQTPHTPPPATPSSTPPPLPPSSPAPSPASHHPPPTRHVLRRRASACGVARLVVRWLWCRLRQRGGRRLGGCRVGGCQGWLGGGAGGVRWGGVH